MFDFDKVRQIEVQNKIQRVKIIRVLEEDSKLSSLTFIIILNKFYILI